MKASTGMAKQATRRSQKYPRPARGAYSMRTSRIPAMTPKTTSTRGICTSGFSPPSQMKKLFSEKPSDVGFGLSAGPPAMRAMNTPTMRIAPTM